MKKKIISAGHICLDITPVFPAEKQYNQLNDILEPGKLINVDAANVNTGGSVANTGLALKILGENVELMGKVGNDAFGNMIADILSKYGAGGLIKDENSSSSYSVVLAIPGIDRVFLHNPGANDTFTNSDIPENSLNDAALFHFGYPPLMRSMYLNDGEELVKIFKRVKEKDIATSLDFAAIDPKAESGKVDWKSILKRVLPYVDFFVPSFEELCFMLDRDNYNRLASMGGDMAENIKIDEDVKPLADELMSMGCKVVLIKCGIKGIYYKTADIDTVQNIGHNLEVDYKIWSNKEGLQPCIKAEKVLSATGAGDTSIAAFLASVLAGKTPEKCVALAAAEGACAVTTYDALSGLKPISELEKMI
ncbi:MAG: carbohydrate kinase family protein [Lachnospiraceae bacterium]|nr:carbohydrate kinase family protein [Lachnospiraceae bacterium]